MNKINTLKFSKISLVILFFGLLSSCKSIELEDGQIPSEYLSQAQAYQGHYRGYFNGFEGVLTLNLIGNRPQLKWKDRRGEDLLSPKCKSLVGKATTIYVDSSSKELSEVTFSFDPGQCFEVEGRQVIISFYQKNSKPSVTAKILNKMNRGYECGSFPSNPGFPPSYGYIHPHPGYGPYPGPEQNCGFVYRPTYFFGEMSRI